MLQEQIEQDKARVALQADTNDAKVKKKYESVSVCRLEAIEALFLQRLMLCRFFLF